MLFQCFTSLPLHRMLGVKTFSFLSDYSWLQTDMLGDRLLYKHSVVSDHETSKALKRNIKRGH